MPKKYATRGAPLHFIQLAIASNTDDCINWPYALSDGYGRARLGNRTIKVHRYVLEQVGTEPQGNRVAAHNCGNRACINPRHLRWDTHQGNLLDRADHGTPGYLSREDVLAIKSDILNRVPTKEIANDYGCTTRLINLIKSGKRHMELTGWSPKNCPAILDKEKGFTTLGEAASHVLAKAGGQHD